MEVYCSLAGKGPGVPERTTQREIKIAFAMGGYFLVESLYVLCSHRLLSLMARQLIFLPFSRSQRFERN